MIGTSDRPCWLAESCKLLLQVGVNYDPMIAKVIARGPDRSTALARLHAALSDLQVCLCCS
jgi:acetyl/propionyl-CoA carboxylase alpha subunit